MLRREALSCEHRLLIDLYSLLRGGDRTSGRGQPTRTRLSSFAPQRAAYTHNADAQAHRGPGAHHTRYLGSARG